MNDLCGGETHDIAGKGGVCAACRAKATAGTAGMKVNCQAAPTSEGLVLSYDS